MTVHYPPWYVPFSLVNFVPRVLFLVNKSTSFVTLDLCLHCGRSIMGWGFLLNI